MIQQLPKQIQQIVGEQPYQQDTVGMSDSQVLCFPDWVLKIEKESRESNQEYQMLQWLQGRLPVPRILFRQQQEGRNYLLMSKIKGEMSCSADFLKQGEQAVAILAEGLQMLWQVDIQSCPVQSTLDVALTEARHRVEHGLCDVEHVEEGTYGEHGFSSPKALLQWLEENRPQEDLVFSHGDFSLPNVFVQNNSISGYIDLGRSGVADRYQDIAICYRSLHHNARGYYGEEVIDCCDPNQLFEKLGIVPDWNKMRYYTLLDELF